MLWASSYDGSRFLGWQTQPGGGTVQDAVESAIATIAAEADVAVTCAGRTDRGVHARGQVVHFDTGADRPDSAWVRGVNALLPESVAVVWSMRTAAGFHARYSARSRTYRYLLINRPGASRAGSAPCRLVSRAPRSRCDARSRKALGRGARLQRVPVERMRGEEPGSHPPRPRHNGVDGRIEFSIRANAFLHHMVRNIVGTLIYVGKGKHQPEWAAQVLESRDRARAAPTFAPRRAVP